MRLGQIGCGRQNPPVQSAELALLRIGMAKGMPSTSLQDWKAASAPLLPQKRRWYDAFGFPYRSACTKQPCYAPGCLYPSRWLHWLRRCAQRTQVYLKLMIIRVNLQFLYRRPNQYKRKLSEWDIQTQTQLVSVIIINFSNVNTNIVNICHHYSLYSYYQYYPLLNQFCLFIQLLFIPLNMYFRQGNASNIYIYIHFTSSRRHKQTSLRLFKAKHGLSHASVSTFKTGSTRHLCPLSKDPAGPSLSRQRTSFT
ncbi:Hypothetical_protein [Hexamita inflata]|uniref:Hypothetical_protein n=1 Tax=Hexamita inflata TaxID=28002 RepID=A0AA86RLK5_9EUKA|nr:Hypothetical protein HINF_LOCUS64708 [Hexamita inflata]